MVKFYLKEGLWRRYNISPAFTAKATKCIKKKEKNAWHGIFSFKWNTEYSYFIQKCDICEIWWERMRLKILIL